jgi:hypothetical protein
MYFVLSIGCYDRVMSTLRGDPHRAEKSENEVISVRDRGDSCRTSRIPHFLDNRLKDGDDVLSLKRLPPSTYRKIAAKLC